MRFLNSIIENFLYDVENKKIKIMSTINNDNELKNYFNYKQEPDKEKYRLVLEGGGGGGFLKNPPTFFGCLWGLGGKGGAQPKKN